MACLQGLQAVVDDHFPLGLSWVANGPKAPVPPKLTPPILMCDQQRDTSFNTSSSPKRLIKKAPDNLPVQDGCICATFPFWNSSCEYRCVAIHLNSRATASYSCNDTRPSLPHWSEEYSGVPTDVACFHSCYSLCETSSESTLSLHTSPVRLVCLPIFQHLDHAIRHALQRATFHHLVFCIYIILFYCMKMYILFFMTIEGDRSID
ncbi:unnamed protein product [Dicrocoelium dendriticum]|nr:unnamed protein product [Dicrocoelium dendriticum]